MTSTSKNFAVTNDESIFNTKLLQVRKLHAQKHIHKAAYLVKEIWQRHFDALRIVVSPDVSSVRVLVLGPSLELHKQIKSQHPQCHIDLCDPLAEPDAFEGLLAKAELYDVVLDTLTFHWMNNPVLYLMQIKMLLKPDGFYGCGFLGGTTITELRQALIEVDIKLFKGAFARCAPMIKPEAATRILQTAGYHDGVVEHEEVIVGYPCVRDVLVDLRMMGETNALRDRTSHLENHENQRSGFSKSYLVELEMAYNKLFKEQITKAALKDPVNMTFDIVYMSGWGA